MSAKSAISAISPLGCRLADLLSILVDQSRTATNGTMSLLTHCRLANFPSAIERPCHMSREGLRPVSGGDAFQVVKTAQSRGRTERTLLSAGALAGRRNAADRREPWLSHFRLLHPSHRADKRSCLSGGWRPMHGWRRRCKAKQGGREDTLTCGLLLPQ